jgi:hypothetical protein
MLLAGSRGKPWLCYAMIEKSFNPEFYARCALQTLGAGTVKE